MGETEGQQITGATLNATKFGIPAALGAGFAAALIGAKEFAEAKIDPSVTIAAFGLIAVGLVAAAAVTIADYWARAHVTAVEQRTLGKEESPLPVPAGLHAAVQSLLTGMVQTAGELPLKQLVIRWNADGHPYFEIRPDDAPNPASTSGRNRTGSANGKARTAG
jgi:hypothetical protein